MLDEFVLQPGLDGRVVRHQAGGIRVRPHRHAEVEVNLVVRGTATYLLGDRRYLLTPGTLTWLFPAQEHVLVDESADHELWWAAFSPGLVARAATTPQARALLESDPAGEFSRHLAAAQARRLYTLFAEIWTVQALDSALASAGLAYLLLLAWRAFLDSTDPVTAADVHPAVREAARLLQTGQEGAPGLADLARAVALSPGHLSRLFKTQTGTSLTRYRNLQRLQRFLLAYSGQHTTVLAAAHAAGFGSYAQFYRVFRQETGQPPAALLAPSPATVSGPRPEDDTTV